MNIFVAPDSFKESLSSLEAGETIKAAILAEIPAAHVEVCPMADGGEGILETLIYATQGRLVQVSVSGPLGTSIRTEYGVLGDNETVVIEVAKIAGLMQVSPSERNPMKTTTFGIGEALVHALKQGYRKFIIGLGGSATNDGGLGMLQALGVAFYDADGKEVSPYGSSLFEVVKADVSHLHPGLNNSHIVIASDVMNPLCGREGATYVFAEQKGAKENELEPFDQAMKKYAHVLEAAFEKQCQHQAGAGAAGGLGFAFMLLGAKLQSGAELVATQIGLKQKLANADIVITGEGKSDKQTLYGKVPAYIAKLAKEYRVKAVLISGSLGKGYEALYEYFDACFSIVNKPMPLEEAMANAKTLLYQQTRNIIRLLKNA